MEEIKPYLPYLFYAIVYGGVGFTVLNILRSLLALGWKTVKGEITYAGISSDCDDEGCTYKPVIEFMYMVRGKEYHSKRFAFGYVFSSFRFLAKMVYSRYKNLPIVTVYYHPNRPKSAVLMPGIRLFHLVDLVFFGVCLYILESNYDGLL